MLTIACVVGGIVIVCAGLFVGVESVAIATLREAANASTYVAMT